MQAPVAMMCYTPLFLNVLGQPMNPSTKSYLLMALKKRRGEVTDVRHPEPFNQYDSSAIAIEGFVDHSWERVGYLVREVLENVHTAQQDNKIVLVELQRVNFITHWTRSQPG